MQGYIEKKIGLAEFQVLKCSELKLQTPRRLQELRFSGLKEGLGFRVLCADVVRLEGLKADILGDLQFKPGTRLNLEPETKT